MSQVHSVTHVPVHSSPGTYLLSEMRGADFDTIAHSFLRRQWGCKRNPRVREVGFQMEGLSDSMRLTYCVADEPASRARLFLETPCERRPAIDSPDAGQRERSRSSIHP